VVWAIAMPGWAAIQLRSRVTRPVTTSWPSKQPQRRVRRRLAGIGAQQLVERLAVVFGESLHPLPETPGWLATAGGAAGLEAKGQERIPRKTTMARRPGNYY
jgi:hypothetical protein